VTRTTSLVGQRILGQARKGAPQRLQAAPRALPTPPQASRSSPNASAFFWRAAAHAARRSTVADLVRHWLKPSETDVGVDAIVARLASQREVLEVVRQQDKNSLLLSPGALPVASVAADNLVRSDGAVSDVVPVDEARVVIDVTLESGLRRLPRAAQRDMLAVQLRSRDFLLVLQSRMWFNTLRVPGLVAPSADSFLMPFPVEMAEMIAIVRGALGPAMVGDTVWELKITGLVIGLRGTAGARDSTLSAARAMAQWWAYASGSFQSVVTMFNHGDEHWCAARVLMDHPVVEYYDPSPNRDSKGITTQTPMSRLKLLGNFILETRGETTAPATGRTWGEMYVVSPSQRDAVILGPTA